MCKNINIRKKTGEFDDAHCKGYLGALGSEVLPTLEIQMKVVADQVGAKAKQICANKSVNFLLYIIYASLYIRDNYR